MVPCNNTHILHHNYKHGDSVYRCSLANAKKLLAEALEYGAQGLLALEKELAEARTPVRPASWLHKALTEVRLGSKSPVNLRLVLFGRKPREGEDTRPPVEVTPAIRDALVLGCFHNDLKLDELNRGGMPLSGLVTLFEKLDFLAPARDRLPKVRLLDDYLYTGLEDLATLRADKWKDTAKEENIVGNNYVPFLNTWGAGTWTLMLLGDA